ncbi:hypothetical protein RI367_000691 [Sorochytrium milnesiophthora]
MSSARVLSYYRAFLRLARRMPTPERRRLVERRSRQEIESNRLERDVDRLAFLYQVAETQLENLSLQADHLQRLQATRQYLIPVDVHQATAPTANSRAQQDADRKQLRAAVKAKMSAKN